MGTVGAMRRRTLTIDLSMATDRETFLRALDAGLACLPPADRVRAARLLADRSTSAHVSDGTDALVYQLTRSATYAQVAEQLGVAEPTVAKAVKRHNKAVRPQG